MPVIPPTSPDRPVGDPLRRPYPHPPQTVCDVVLEPARTGQFVAI